MRKFKVSLYKQIISKENVSGKRQQRQREYRAEMSSREALEASLTMVDSSASNETRTCTASETRKNYEKIYQIIELEILCGTLGKGGKEKAVAETTGSWNCAA